MHRRLLAMSLIFTALVTRPVIAHRVEGTVYCDVNRDETIDPGDTPIPSVHLRATSLDADPGAEAVTGADLDGHYVIDLLQRSDRYLVEPLPPVPYAPVVFPPDSFYVATIVTGTPSDVATGLDFLMQGCTPPTTTTGTTVIRTNSATVTALPTTTPPPLDHFQCYEIKPKAFTTIAGVSVQDPFGP